LDKLVHGAFECHICSLMHRNLPAPSMIGAAGTEAIGADRLLLAVLPVQSHIRARLVQMHVLIDMIDP
jgi:hypothetical protein